MTPPPTKYAEAPGIESSAAEIRPPVDDSEMATVSRRATRRAATEAARDASRSGTAGRIARAPGGRAGAVLPVIDSARADDTAVRLPALQPGLPARRVHAGQAGGRSSARPRALARGAGPEAAGRPGGRRLPPARRAGAGRAAGRPRVPQGRILARHLARRAVLGGSAPQGRPGARRPQRGDAGADAGHAAVRRAPDGGRHGHAAA